MGLFSSVVSHTFCLLYLHTVAMERLSRGLYAKPEKRLKFLNQYYVHQC